MSTPTAGVVYGWDVSSQTWTAPGRVALGNGVPVDPDSVYKPVSLPADVTDAGIRATFGVPSDANLVRWTFGESDLETVFKVLGANDVLVLPERDNPYLIDSSKGFMASGVSGVDGTGADGKKDGSIVPIVSNSRLWFEMTRARRGVIGLGPAVVIEPSVSAWSAPRQPILQNEPSGSQFQKAYFIGGGSMDIVGAQETMMGYEHANPIFANFTIRGRDFGGVAYNTIGRTGGTAALATFKRIVFDGSWRSHAGVPNGETGALTFQNGTYLVENCDVITPSTGYGGGSPMMWNRTTGGTVRHVRSRGTKPGMWTFWRCGGRNVFEDVSISSGQTGMNIEELLAGFELDWTGGAMTVGLDFTGNKFHFAINPSGGAPKIALHGVTLSLNAYTPGAMTANVYSTTGVAKRSWVTCDTAPVSCVPSSAWID